MSTEALDTIESLWTRYDIGEHDGLGRDTWVGHMVGTNALRYSPYIVSVKKWSMGAIILGVHRSFGYYRITVDTI